MSAFYRVPFLILNDLYGGNPAAAEALGNPSLAPTLRKITSPNCFRSSWPRSIDHAAVKRAFLKKKPTSGYLCERLTYYGFGAWADAHRGLAPDTLLSALLEDARAKQTQPVRLPSELDRASLLQYYKRLLRWADSSPEQADAAKVLLPRLCFDLAARGQLHIYPGDLDRLAAQVLPGQPAGAAVEILTGLGLLTSGGTSAQPLYFREEKLRNFFAWVYITEGWARSAPGGGDLSLSRFEPERNVLDLALSLLGATPAAALAEGTGRLSDAPDPDDFLPRFVLALARRHIGEENNSSCDKEGICAAYRAPLEQVCAFCAPRAGEGRLDMDLYLDCLTVLSEILRRLGDYDGSRRASGAVRSLSREAHYTEPAANNIAKCLLLKYCALVSDRTRPVPPEWKREARDRFREAFAALNEAADRSFLSQNLYAFLLHAPDPVTALFMDELHIPHGPCEAFRAFASAALSAERLLRWNHYAEEQMAFLLLHGEVSVEEGADLGGGLLCGLAGAAVRPGRGADLSAGDVRLAERLLARQTADSRAGQSTLYLRGLYEQARGDLEKARATFGRCSFLNARLRNIALRLEQYDLSSADHVERLWSNQRLLKAARELAPAFDPGAVDLLPIRIDARNSWYLYHESARLLDLPEEAELPRPITALRDATEECANRTETLWTELQRSWSLFPSDTVEHITRLLFPGKPAEQLSRPCDLVVVLGSDFIAGTMDAVKDLCDGGIIAPDALILLSGARGRADADNPETESARLLDYAVRVCGMDPSRFVLEPRAVNAYENLLFSRELIGERGGFARFSRVLLIGKAFLGGRAMMNAAHLGYPMERLEYFGTVDRDGLNIGPDCWWESDAAARRVMAELERIGLYYRKFGNLSL